MSLGLYTVADLDFEEILACRYDVIICASGYEDRSTHIPKLVRDIESTVNVILGFREQPAAGKRSENDSYYFDEWDAVPEVISGSNDDELYGVLNTICSGLGPSVSMLVDYSAMSRIWYAGILNWLRYNDTFHQVKIDFTYAVGEHKWTSRDMVVEDIVAIPGFEGGGVYLFETVALVGLGFDGPATQNVLDQLEPDTTYTYLASPAAFHDYPARTKLSNREVIERFAKATFELPLFSVASTFRYLAEIAGQHRSHGDVVLLPMGPKPHVLAAILIALRFEEIACLRVVGSRSPIEPVGTTGKIVSTRVNLARNVDSTSNA